MEGYRDLVFTWFFVARIIKTILVWFREIHQQLIEVAIWLSFADRTKGQLLDWSKRFKIITGLTEGLVYLHKGSMSCLVHRDLKPHNILLDYNMSPKITDFGSARTLSSDVAEGRTSRVVGTRYQLPTILIITYSHHLFSDVLISQSSHLLFHFSVVTKLRSICILRSLLDEDRCVQLWRFGSGDY